jgi:hypothetical protein
MNKSKKINPFKKGDRVMANKRSNDMYHHTTLDNNWHGVVTKVIGCVCVCKETSSNEDICSKKTYEILYTFLDLE